MEYTLKIGEAKLVYDPDPEYPYIWIDVEEVSLPEAPASGLPTDYTNVRFPGYCAWYEFTKFVGLEDVFYNEDYGLIRKYPEVVPICKFHQERIDKAYNKFLRQYPDVDPEGDDVLSYHFDRLRWLKFWIDWALKNCKHPIFFSM